MGKAAQAAAELEDAFFRSIPANARRRLSEEEWTKSLGKFHEGAREIRKRNALGIFGRAHAAYLLQQRLIAAGLSGDIVRKVVFALIMSSFSGKG